MVKTLDKLISVAKNVHNGLQKHYGTMCLFGLMGILCVFSGDSWAADSNKITLGNITKDFKGWITGDITQIVVTIIGLGSGAWGALTGNVNRITVGGVCLAFVAVCQAFY